jgi:hypothetical protein
MGDPEPDYDSFDDRDVPVDIPDTLQLAGPGSNLLGMSPLL